jgi:undecaprenyl diphosphate synthase
MDGNGRWAQNRGMSRIMGHQAGIEATRSVVRAARKIGVKYLTLFALSTENLNRPKPELNALFSLLREFIVKDIAEMIENNVRLIVIGRLTLLPRDIQELIADAVARTRKLKKMTLVIGIAYGGRDEIVRATEKFARSGRKKLTEKDFSGLLDTAGIPDPDLLIRTGGELRISNFLVWQSAYTELCFTRTLWPDFSRRHLQKAVREFNARERRYGLTSEQLGHQKQA